MGRSHEREHSDALPAAGGGSARDDGPGPTATVTAGRRWAAVGAVTVGVLSILVVALLVVSNVVLPKAPDLATGMVFEKVAVQPQPDLTDTFQGKCAHNTIDAGGITWHEYNHSRTVPVVGRLEVTSVYAKAASARFEGEDGTVSGWFMATWNGGFYPTSDPCGI